MFQVGATPFLSLPSPSILAYTYLFDEHFFLFIPKDTRKNNSIYVQKPTLRMVTDERASEQKERLKQGGNTNTSLHY